MVEIIQWVIIGFLMNKVWRLWQSVRTLQNAVLVLTAIERTE